MQIRSRIRGLAVVLAWGLVACDRGGSEDGGDDEAAAQTTGTDTGEAAVCDAPLGEGACAAQTVCDAYECGGKTAPFNHYGCARTACDSDDACAAGERCFAVVLDTACRDGVAACEEVDGACACDAEAVACMGTNDAHCLPIEVYPAEGDCDAAAIVCDEVTARRAALVMAREHHDALGNAGLVAAIDACDMRLSAREVECAG